MKPDVAQDTAHSAVVTEHEFTPDPKEPWGLCKWRYDGRHHLCNLSRAAHAEGPIYVPGSPKAEPEGPRMGINRHASEID